MVQTNYQVQTEFRIGVAQGAAALRSLSGRVGDLAQRIKGAQGITRGLVGSLASLGVGYLGFTAVTNTIRSSISAAADFRNELEKTQIGLASVLQAVDGTDFESAMGTARDIYDQLAEDAIISTATTREMFGVYQAILGPIRAAGFELSKVREITNQTIAASSALNVDFGQAQRDISLMVRGAAGMDVKLFSMLRSTGAIAETTEEWNRNLSAQERVVKLSQALGKFSDAAEAYGKSWAGITSSFRDIAEQLIGHLTGPAFNALKNFIGSINDRILANKDAVVARLKAIGERVGQSMSEVFDRALAGIDHVAANWDRISDRMREIVRQIREVAPTLGKVAVVLGAIQVGRGVLGTFLGAISGIMGAVGTLGGLFGAGSAGAGAAGAAGGAAGAAGAEGAAAGAASALGAAAAPLAVILSGLAGVVYVLIDQWERVKMIFAEFEPILEETWADLKEAGGYLWESFRPLLKLIGSNMLLVMAPFIAALFAAVGALRLMAAALKAITKTMAAVAAFFEPTVDLYVDLIFGMFEAIASGIRKVMNLLGLIDDTRVSSATPVDHGDPLGELAQQIGTGEDAGGGRFRANPNQELPGERPQTINDFRGSRISVEQNFRQGDPDRILVAMQEGINAQAERRIQSSFAPALTR